jgi:hypothetical protein
MFTITIETDNEAFEDVIEWPAGTPDGKVTEVGRILREVTARLLGGELEGTIIDFHGNRVGTFALER